MKNIISFTTICIIIFNLAVFAQNRDWSSVIDTTWGEGLPTEEKLKIFDIFWDEINEEYPGFPNLDIDWNLLREKYRPEVAAGVSRGRFTAIMNKLTLALMDRHTSITDIVVSRDSLKPGVPIFVPTGYQSILNRDLYGTDYEYCHFGASLTPLEDSTLLVYDVISDHPLGLERGDIVLGYEGMLWKDLYKELLEAELPIWGDRNYGSNEFSVIHGLLTSAGENWHLFDTIDVVKYSTGDTVHLATSLLQDKKMKLYSTGQMHISGVPFPDVDNDHYVSRGIVEGTNIGYIYAWNWQNRSSTGDEFREAIQSLINEHNLSGLILDSRYNRGGGTAFKDGLHILFNQHHSPLDGYERSDPHDHYAFKPFEVCRWNLCDTTVLDIDGDNYLFDRPIAVLTGPSSQSGGDYMPLQMRFHPMSRLFGLTTNGAFGAMIFMEDRPVHPISNFSDWIFHRTVVTPKLVSNPDQFLIHLTMPPDEEIWLSKEDVINGEDTVVKRAIEWINNLAYAHDVSLNKTYINSSNDSVLVSAIVENPNNNELSVKAILSNYEKTYVDSFYFHNDGMNSDIVADDSIWVVDWATRGIEETYYIAVKTENLTENTVRTLPNVVNFTTIGPITFEGYTMLSKESITFPNPGYKIQYNFRLKNMGSTATAPNVTMKIICTDSSASFLQWQPMYISNLSYGDIEPGETVLVQKDIYYFNNYSDPVHFALEIYSDGYFFWSDTFSIDVEPATLVEKFESKLPKVFALEQNYPNPFNPSTKIKFSLPKSDAVTIEIYNIIGQKIQTLLNKPMPAGYHELDFNGQNLSSGIYLYRIETGAWTDVKKMILLR